MYALDAETLAPTGPAVPVDGRIITVSAGPDGRTAIVLTGEPSYALVDLVDGRVIGEGPLGSEPSRAEFSPDGRWIAISLLEGVGVLDVETGDWVRTPVDGHDLSISSLAYAPDGNLIASGSEDGRVGLWDGRTGALLATMLPGRANVPVTVSFLPDGHTVLISAIDGAVYTWDTRVESWIAHACATAGRNFTRDEWRDAFPHRPYRRTCPEHPAGT